MALATTRPACTKRVQVPAIRSRTAVQSGSRRQLAGHRSQRLLLTYSSSLSFHPGDDVNFSSRIALPETAQTVEHLFTARWSAFWVGTRSRFTSSASERVEIERDDQFQHDNTDKWRTRMIPFLQPDNNPAFHPPIHSDAVVAAWIAHISSITTPP